MPLRLDGRTHTNLTVRDLEVSVPWYRGVFGMVQVNDVTPPESGFRFVTLVHPQSFSSVVLGQAVDPGDVIGDRFDERRIGLHHHAYHVPERADLQEWDAHLTERGIEHSPVFDSAHEAGSQIWFRDPDNIWLEIYWTNREFFARRLREQWRAARRSGKAGSWLGS
jgi:glyoxylase I family protein